MKKIIVVLLLVQLMISIPVLDRVIYGHSDPFVAHTIVSSYVLNRTGNLESATSFLTKAFHNVNGKTWIWQISTAEVLKDYIVGAPLLLYTLGTVSNIDYKVLGYSPLVYFVYMLLFFTIVREIIKNLSVDTMLAHYKIMALVALISAGMDFLRNYVFALLIGFQYHAIALVMYLSIILLFLRYLMFERWPKRILILLTILYVSLLITHYRFPTLILGNITLYAVFFMGLWILHREPNYSCMTKFLFGVTVLLITLFYFQPFYWTQLKYHRSNFINFLFIFKYLSEILSRQREAGSGMSFENPLVSAIQKYNLYLMSASWIATVIILLLFTIRYSKTYMQNSLRGSVFFLWNIGSTLIYNFTYFLYYYGLQISVGLSLYEPWIVAISLVPFFAGVLNLGLSRVKSSLTAVLAVLFSVSLMIGSITTLYFLVVYPPHPDPPRYQADTSLPFLLGALSPSGVGSGVVVGSSFSVSAELYEETAKYKLPLLQHLGYVRIVNEVLAYNEDKNLTEFLNKLRQRNDFLLITQYEERHGLSSDVFGRKSYVLPTEISFLKLYFNQVYNSNLVTILRMEG